MFRTSPLAGRNGQRISGLVAYVLSQEYVL
jgi:hypothetical protein